MFITDKLGGSLTVPSTQRVIHILNQHDIESALVHDSFALTVCSEILL